jgi:5'-methylthioadenosine phosphorylase
MSFFSPIAVLGGTTFELGGPFAPDLITGAGDEVVVETPVGASPPFQRMVYRETPFYYVRFHGYSESGDRSDRISGMNFVRMFAALHLLGVRYAFGGATSGGIREDYNMGDLVLPGDLLEFNKERPSNVWEAGQLVRPQVRARFASPFCPYLSRLLEESAAKHGEKVHKGDVLVQSQPNRYETPAEIRMYSRLGGDLVTHNVGTGAIYARQMGIHFAALQSISNPAEGVRPFTIEQEMADGAAISRRAIPILLDAIAMVGTADCGITCTGEPFEGVVS